MKVKSIITALVTGVVAVSILAGCGNTTKEAETKNKPLRVATNATFVPFEFKDNDNSSDYKGFEMDLIRAVAKEMGKDIELNNIAFSGIIPIIQQGDMDIAATGMTMTKERAQKVAFAAPFYESKLVILTPKDSGITTADDIKGKQIAVQIGTTGAKYAEDNGYTVKQFDNNSEVIMELQVGGSPAAILDKPVADYFLTQDGKDKFNIIEVPNTKPEYLAFAVNKDNKDLVDQVNKAMAKLKETGEFQQIYKKWFNTEMPDLPTTGDIDLQ
ncbi:MAG: basic amino acid ABC transporter substrate-binding protein [Caecibacter sp.]|jgi:polar amino acid transport system substrate-binding protein|nr:basic amino acid ABC transporter substrate-binding protein [Megasphaera sp.]MEE0721079.1 basic amino acid ABC transporter substrate-binding protein [Caecibacter sp.]